MQKGVTLPQMNIVDVTPALLYSLGLDIPSDIEGVLPIDAFEPALLEKQPVTIGAPTQLPDSYAVEEKKEKMSAEEEEEVYKQMKALGYVE